MNAILKWQSKISCCIKQLLTTFNFINEMSFSQAKTSHQKIVDGFKWKIIMVVGKIKKKGLLVSCFLYYFLWVVALSRKQGCVVLTKIQLVPVLNWWCLAVLNHIVLYPIVWNVTYFPILIWQNWTKYWTKVVIHGNLVHTKVMPKGITNLSTLRYMTARFTTQLLELSFVLVRLANKDTFTALSQITLDARQTGSSSRSYRMS